ncbi:MAG TPA: translation initiation factor IF-3 [Alphaproteobacteria bacterium]|nr:translation initiation factor IF-3 [Alphaproteobacteria bacterium]
MKRTGKNNPLSEDLHKINNQITTDPIRVIDSEGNMLGILSLKEGIEKAEELGLDLVEVSPNAKPPVCKIIEYGKFKYAAQKKAAEARKKQKTVEVKEIKFRPNIDTNDYEIKMRSVRKFISAGDKVKITMRFRGREMTHQDIGVKVLRRIREDLDTTVKIEQFPKLEGRQMVQIFAPNLSEKVDSPRQVKDISVKE